jgi:hypothetical protein
MNVKNFIISVKESLGLEDFKKSGKKKSVRKLLKKLNERQDEILESLKQKPEKKEKKELKEELEIISLQIKKGEKILEKLNSRTV